MAYQDQTLICRDCGKSFVFTARDQEFFAEKGFTNAPTRCKECRTIKKKAPVGAPGMGGPKTLFKITCKKCGKVGEMATEPRKPEDVLCSECFYEDFKKQLEAQGHTLDPKVKSMDDAATNVEEPAPTASKEEDE